MVDVPEPGGSELFGVGALLRVCIDSKVTNGLVDERSRQSASGSRAEQHKSYS